MAGSSAGQDVDAWNDDDTRAENGLTVVDGHGAAKGLGTALKRRQLAWAAANGLRELVTWTQDANAAMRQVNTRLGYVTRTLSRTSCGRALSPTTPTAYRSAMTRILVTGGAGYVGSVSVEALLAGRP